MKMKIREIVLHRLHMPLQMRFETSFGVESDRDVILVEAISEDGLIGWGESVALKRPLYNEETTDTVFAILSRELIPLVLENEFSHPAHFTSISEHIRGNRMAKSAIEACLWDIWAQEQSLPLARAIGGHKSVVDVGVSLSIQPLESLLLEVRRYVEEGYRRIKLKIKPGWDERPIAFVREAFPDVQLMADANSAYKHADISHLANLEKYNLMMIEQPFLEDAWESHQELQELTSTPICLDESIRTLDDATRAIRMKACKIINVKLGRIGGIQPALEITNIARESGIALWCGGMFETGIGRAFNIAIATLEGFTLPGDTAASSRYWKPDIIEPEVMVEKGHIHVPSRPGRGYEVNLEKVARYQQRQWHFRH